MTSHSHKLAVLAVIAAGLLPSTAAQAQLFGSSYSRPAPLYPYVAQQQPYAVEVAPDTYVIRRPAHVRTHNRPHSRNYGSRASVPKHARAAARFDRPHKRANRVLIEELRRRQHAKGHAAGTTRIVREAPVVIEHRRIVDDPPRVIVRQDGAEDAPMDTPVEPAVSEERPVGRGLLGGGHGSRVIRADAEITIQGPDRMSVRLFRKRHSAKFKRHADE